MHLPPAAAQPAAQTDGRIPPAPPTTSGNLRPSTTWQRFLRHRAAGRQDGAVRARPAQAEGDGLGGAGGLHDAIRGDSVLHRFFGHGRCVSGEGRVKQAGFYAGVGADCPGAQVVAVAG